MCLQYRQLHGEHAHFKENDAASLSKDLGMLGVLIHIACDALNNVGVIVAAVIMLRTSGKSRFYADPAVSLGISLMIVGSAYPLIKRSGAILLQASPARLDVKAIQADLEAVRQPRRGRSQETDRLADSRRRIGPRAPHLASRREQDGGLGTHHHVRSRPPLLREPSPDYPTVFARLRTALSNIGARVLLQGHHKGVQKGGCSSTVPGHLLDRVREFWLLWWGIVAWTLEGLLGEAWRPYLRPPQGGLRDNSLLCFCCGFLGDFFFFFRFSLELLV